MTINERIKSRRIKLGKTVDDVAKAIKKNRATVYRYENSYIENLPVSIIALLADALDCSPAYLMGWENEPNDDIVVLSDELTIGEKIRELRKQNDMTQSELAEKIGVSKSTVAMYEISRNYPNLEMVKRLCKVLSVTGDYLIGLVDNPTETYKRGISKESLRSDEEQLLTNYNKLNPTGKDKAQEYTKDLTENEKYTAPPELKTKLNA